MKTERQGLQSTKATNKEEDDSSPEDSFLPSDSPNVKCNEVCYALIDIEKDSVAHMDLTGCFPKRSHEVTNVSW